VPEDICFANFSQAKKTPTTKCNDGLALSASPFVREKSAIRDTPAAHKRRSQVGLVLGNDDFRCLIGHPSFFEGWDFQMRIAGDFAFHFLSPNRTGSLSATSWLNPCTKRMGGPPAAWVTYA
jgi:hypothetical protein